MYPVKRYIKILKGYTKNLHCLEASIVERYIAEEAIEFCSGYIEKAKPVGHPKSRHDERVGEVRFNQDKCKIVPHIIWVPLIVNCTGGVWPCKMSLNIYR